MSLKRALRGAWQSVRRSVAPVLPGVLPGPLGQIVGAAITPRATPMTMPGGAGLPAVVGAALPALLPAVAGTAARVAVGSARRIAAGAASLCRRHPAWCAGIGGVAAVEGLMRSGQLPVPRRRKGRGITATELRAFKRVARFTSQYCAPVRRAMSAPAVRGGRKCR